MTAGSTVDYPYHPPCPIRTERLILRPMVERDASDLLAYRGLPEVARYVPFEPMTAEVIADRLAGMWSRVWIDAPGDGFLLGVEAPGEGGRLVGDVMLHWASEEHRNAEVGYCFNPEFGGKGYATEAAAAILGLAFDGLGAHRVYARIDARNDASARLATRLGMRQEAHLVENEWFKGEWTDELVYAMLAREWMASRGV